MDTAAQRPGLPTWMRSCRCSTDRSRRPRARALRVGPGRTGATSAPVTRPLSPHRDPRPAMEPRARSVRARWCCWDSSRSCSRPWASSSGRARTVAARSIRRRRPRGAMTVGARLRAIELADHAGVALLGLGFLVAASWPRKGRGCAIRRRSGPRWSRPRPTCRPTRSRSRHHPGPALEDPGGGAGREGSAALVKDLNDQLEHARVAAGLIPLTGTGIVLQVEGSLEPADPEGQRRRTCSSGLATCARSSRSCGQLARRRSRSMASG